MLSEAEINALEDVLFDDAWADHALDFFGLHGLLCASVVGPKALLTEEVMALATSQEVEALTNTPIPAAFAELTERLAHLIRQQLERDETLELPEPEDGDPLNALENWCAGFVEAFMLYEDMWLDANEEEVAELMLPIMALSGLFDDEDFASVRDNAELAQQMAEQIPDTLAELYLFFHTPS
ncbi:MAG: YecA family protein [Gammaproteobacteria bacterium]|nr:YecA family protein [Gammaproteobacteria bacterium]